MAAAGPPKGPGQGPGKPPEAEKPALVCSKDAYKEPDVPRKMCVGTCRAAGPCRRRPRRMHALARAVQRSPRLPAALPA